MKDKKMLAWLEENMNKRAVYYFEDDNKESNNINCYLKEDDSLFCIYFRDKVQIMMDNDISITN